MARGFVKKRNDIWYAYWRDPSGKQRSKAVSQRKKDAEKYLISVQKSVLDGVYKEITPITFNEFAEIWIRDYGQLFQKASTLYSNKMTLRSSLVPFFGEKHLENILPSDVQKYIAKRFEQGKASGTVRKQVVLLRSMLNLAIEWDYLKVNPIVKVKLPREEYKEIQPMTPEEIKLFFDVLDDEWRPLFHTLIFTGMRLGELLALQWSDIYWSKDIIRVQRSAWNGQFVEPKTRGSIRSITMSPSLKSVLFKLFQDREITEMNLVFPNENGHMIGSSNLRQRIFEPALKAAGLRKIRIHDLRHTYASLLIAQGENLKYIQKQLGHTSITTTVDRYGHLMPDAHNGVGERLDAAIFG